VLSEATVKALTIECELADLGPHAVKGRDEPVVAYVIEPT
jgi:class 3 adenylate cyclase